MGHHCACRPSERGSNRFVSAEASNRVVALDPVGRCLPSNPRLERTGRRPVRHGRAARAAGRSTAGRSASLHVSLIATLLEEKPMVARLLAALATCLALAGCASGLL